MISVGDREKAQVPMYILGQFLRGRSVFLLNGKETLFILK